MRAGYLGRAVILVFAVEGLGTKNYFWLEDRFGLLYLSLFFVLLGD